MYLELLVAPIKISQPAPYQGHAFKYAVSCSLCDRQKQQTYLYWFSVLWIGNRLGSIHSFHPQYHAWLDPRLFVCLILFAHRIQRNTAQKKGHDELDNPLNRNYPHSCDVCPPSPIIPQLLESQSKGRSFLWVSPLNLFASPFHPRFETYRLTYSPYFSHIVIKVGNLVI